MAKTGRPSDYSDKTADSICERIAKGEALHIICREASMPDNATVYRWLENNAEFRDKYARARERQQDYEADHIVEIADTAEDANIARLQIDARKWRASKLHPKKYSDTTKITGADGGAVVININKQVYDDGKTTSE